MELFKFSRIIAEFEDSSSTAMHISTIRKKW